jgi:GNAT superfamily N-acetyltransferase
VNAEYRVRPATPADAEEYVRTHIELTNVAYLHYAPPGFAPTRRSEHDERVRELLDEIAEAEAATTSGRDPFRRHWVAVNPLGTIVGVMSSGRGIEPWERVYFRTRWVPPATDVALSHLYLAPGTHGSGLAQRMLDIALPDGRAAYLWAFDQNLRAASFYRRNGFSPDGLHGRSGRSWGGMPMSRWTRPDGSQHKSTP